MTRPIVAAIDMGYGHLRPAAALAGFLETPVLQMDQPPLGNEHDHQFWERTRKLYEPLTRFSQLPAIGPDVGGQKRCGRALRGTVVPRRARARSSPGTAGHRGGEHQPHSEPTKLNGDSCQPFPPSGLVLRFTGSTASDHQRSAAVPAD